MNLLNNAQAASLIGIAPNTLKYWRHVGRGPAFIKLGDSPQAGVAYYETEVISWRNSRKFGSTSAYSPAGQANVRPTISRTPELTR